MAHPNYPPVIKGAAQENIEKILLTPLDYIASSSLKRHNRDIPANGDYIVLVHGGKCFAEYVEKDHRPDSYDWDVHAHIKNSIGAAVFPDIAVQVCRGLADNINTMLQTMHVFPFTVHYAIQTVKNDPGFRDPHISVIPAKNIQLEARYGVRISQTTVGMQVAYVCLCIIDAGQAKNILTIFEVVTEPENPNQIISWLDAVRTYRNMPMQILNNKQFYPPYDRLKANIRSLINNPTYPKQDKARARLRILDDAENSGFLHCALRNRPECMNRVVFDFTDTPAFVEISTVKDQHITQDAALVISDADFTRSIAQYTGGGYIPVNNYFLLQYYLNWSNADFANKFTAGNLQRAQRIDNGLIRLFDRTNTNVISYGTNPLILFRHVTYMDIQNTAHRALTLETIRVGDIIPLVNYSSTTTTNKNSACAPFISESQFRGCCFIIRALSSRGTLALRDVSNFPAEKEVLLDRRGSLEITRRYHGYILESFDGFPVYRQRLVLECNYHPFTIGAAPVAAPVAAPAALAAPAAPAAPVAAPVAAPAALAAPVVPNHVSPIVMDTYNIERRQRMLLQGITERITGGSHTPRESKNVSLYGGDPIPGEATLPADSPASVAMTIAQMFEHDESGIPNVGEPLVTRNTITGPIKLVPALNDQLESRHQSKVSHQIRIGAIAITSIIVAILIVIIAVVIYFVTKAKEGITSVVSAFL